MLEAAAIAQASDAQKADALTKRGVERTELLDLVDGAALNVIAPEDALRRKAAAREHRRARIAARAAAKAKAEREAKKGTINLKGAFDAGIQEREKLAAAQAAAAARKKKGIGNLKDAFEGDEAVARGPRAPRKPSRQPGRRRKLGRRLPSSRAA